MKIALVSEHASPLATLGGVDAGGQNVHVAELARGLAELGAQVVVHTRRDDPTLARRVELAPERRCRARRRRAARTGAEGRAAPVHGRVRRRPPAFVVARHTGRRPFALLDVGIRSAACGPPLDLPVAHTYHALGAVKRRHQGAARHEPDDPRPHRGRDRPTGRPRPGHEPRRAVGARPHGSVARSRRSGSLRSRSRAVPSPRAEGPRPGAPRGPPRRGRQSARRAQGHRQRHRGDRFASPAPSSSSPVARLRAPAGTIRRWRGCAPPRPSTA